MTMKRGKFITFEGPEGGGKSTQARAIRDYLANRGYEVDLRREPGGTTTGERIRNLLQHESTDAEIHARTEVLLFQASRAQLVQEAIIPALKRGVYVLCDRFYDSSTAYQGYGRGFDIEEIELLNKFATGGLVPDLTFLLDLPATEGFKRLEARRNEEGKITKKDRIESAPLKFHERLREGYLEIAKKYPKRFVVLDAMQKQEEIYQIMIKTIREKFCL
jgi:dTMP kinase